MDGNHEVIKSHKRLTEVIQGKRILHLLSLGKDSVLALEWLVNYAKIKEITSVFFKFIAEHPGDQPYFNYLRHRYPTVNFITRPNPIELTNILNGVYQPPPLESFEYDTFDFKDSVDELVREGKYDLVCDGASKYETFARRTKFHQKGLLFRNRISPLGMMSRAEVIETIKNSGIKLHKCYKFSKGTLDHPSYFKMRTSFLADPLYYKKMIQIYPLLVLDKFRYEMMLK